MQALSHTAKISRAGNKALKIIGTGVIVILLLFGVYTLWYAYMVYNQAFLHELEEYKPSIDDGGNNVTLRELMAINPDVCGWITIEETGIDYPILQGRGNLDYIQTDVYGEFSLAGSIFLDSGNDREFTDFYNIIYGHHMESSTMFGDVLEFLDEDYFNSHDKGILFLPDKTYEISFVSAMEADAYDRMVMTPKSDYSSSPELLSYIEDNSTVSSNVRLGSNDNIISLVTCENANTNGRAVLFGKIEPIAFKEQGTYSD